MIKYKVGDKLKCVHSKSTAYSMGKIYEVSLDKAGVLVLTGNDGLTDPMSRLLSAFKKVESVNEKTKNKE